MLLVGVVLYETNQHCPNFFSDFLSGGSRMWRDHIDLANKIKNEDLFHSCLGEECEVQNKASILDVVNQMIADGEGGGGEGGKGEGRREGTPAAVEFLFVEPSYDIGAEGLMGMFVNFCFGFGHAVLRYTHEGQEIGLFVVVVVCCCYLLCCFLFVVVVVVVVVIVIIVIIVIIVVIVIIVLSSSNEEQL